MSESLQCFQEVTAGVTSVHRKIFRHLVGCYLCIGLLGACNWDFLRRRPVHSSLALNDISLHSRCKTFSSSDTSFLKMETACFSQTWVSTYDSTCHHNQNSNIGIFTVLGTSDMTQTGSFVYIWLI